MYYCRWLAALCVALAALPALARTWTVNNQKEEGDFVKESHGVVLLYADGKMFPVPMKYLSTGDRNYVKEQEEWQKKTLNQVEERTWINDQCGTIQARLMGMEKAKVVLLVRGEKGTGSFRLPFDKFIAADQDYVRREMTNRGEGDKVPKKAAPKQIAQVTPGTGSPSQPNKPKQPPKNKKPRKPKPKPKPPGTQPDAAKPTGAQPTGVAPAPVASANQPAEVKQAQAVVEVKQSQPEDKQTGTTIVVAAVSDSTPKPLLAAPPAKSTSAVPESSPPAPPVKYRICSHCGRELPESSRLGGECPYCGAHFAYEETDQDRHSEPATFRSMCAPFGFVSLLGVIVATGFRLGWYFLRR